MTTAPPPSLIIIQDTREQAPLPITRYPVVIDTLPIGDYGIVGFSGWERPRFIIERKSLSDLAGSLGKGRERFMREIEKMRQFEFRALVIEGLRDHVELRMYPGEMNPSSILATLDALIVRAGLHVEWAGDRIGAARRVEALAEKFVTGIERDHQALVKSRKTVYTPAPEAAE